MNIQKNALNVFERVEKKYLISETKYRVLLRAMEPYMEIDQYGLHTICNIYYDTTQDELIRNSIEQPVYKEKLRLRSYGIPVLESQVFLEIKKKYEGVVYKRRFALTLNEAERYMNHGIKPKDDNQIFRELDYFIQFYTPKAKLYLAYDRVAFQGKEDTSIRMTFDTNIRSRTKELFLEIGDYGESLLEKDMYLLEIKAPASYPMWLTNLLSDLKIYPVSFSKYGSIYKKNMAGNTEELRRRFLCFQAS